MEQARVPVPHELQLNQLPEGTEIQVRPLPLAFAYKKLGGQWNPIESIPAVYKPLIGDEFPLGSIAVDPEGIAYVKGFAGCQSHPLAPQCLCMRPLCWLLVGRIFAPRQPLGEAPAQQPAEPLNEDIAMGAVVPAQDVQDDLGLDVEPNMSNMGVGFNHSGSDLPAPGGQAHSTGNGYLDGYETVHEGDIQQLSGSAFDNTIIDSELQEVRHTTLGSDSCTIHFGPHGEGIPLSAINTLDDHLFAFEQGSSLNIKASFRFRFRYWQNVSELGDHVDRRKQVNIRHSNKEGPPISLRAMARLVLSELMAEMTTMADLNYPLCHGGLPVRVEDLVLVRVERVKFGTLQPVFKLRR